MHVIEIGGEKFYSTGAQGDTYTLAELSLNYGGIYKCRLNGEECQVVFLGLDTYRGMRKYLFAVFADGVWQGYWRTCDWKRLMTISRHPLAVA